MMMNNCAIQQKKGYASSRDDIGRDYVVCPKPRRAGISIRSAGWHNSHQADIYDSKAGNELLDIILAKGGSGGGQDTEQIYTHMSSSPRFFSGSPPSRVSNPLIQDARFVEVKQHAFIAPSTHLQHPNLSILNSSPSSASRKSGFARASFGNNPVVRVEGFEALDRDGRNCSIPALA